MFVLVQCYWVSELQYLAYPLSDAIFSVFLDILCSYFLPGYRWDSEPYITQTSKDFKELSPSQTLFAVK